MKRQGIVLNAREVRAGRRLLKAAAKSSFIQKQAKALLGRGPAFAARFYRAAQMTAAHYGIVTDLNTAILVRAAAGNAAQMAAEFENDGWLSMAAAIRYIGS